jgi:hypothetical protein
MAPSLLAIVNPSGSQGTSQATNKQIGIVYANPTITSQSTNGNSTVNASDGTIVAAGGTTVNGGGRRRHHRSRDSRRVRRAA